MSQDASTVGGGAVLFLNDGSDLTLENITVTDGVFAESVLVTADSATGDATTTLRDFVASNSNVNVSAEIFLVVSCSNVLTNRKNVFVFLEGSTVQAFDIEISEMNYIESVFNITNSGTSIIVEDLDIINNEIASDTHTWIGISLDDGATGGFKNMTFCNNSHVQHVVEVDGAATLAVDIAEVCNVFGGQEVVSDSPGNALVWMEY